MWLVRGDASAEELAAVIAVIAALAAVRAEPGDAVGDAPTGDAAAASATLAPSRWAARAPLVRRPHHHGPGGWRASALPR